MTMSTFTWQATWTFPHITIQSALVLCVLYHRYEGTVVEVDVAAELSRSVDSSSRPQFSWLLIVLACYLDCRPICSLRVFPDPICIFNKLQQVARVHLHFFLARSDGTTWHWTFGIKHRLLVSPIPTTPFRTAAWCVGECGAMLA